MIRLVIHPVLAASWPAGLCASEIKTIKTLLKLTLKFSVVSSSCRFINCFGLHLLISSGPWLVLSSIQLLLGRYLEDLILTKHEGMDHLEAGHSGHSNDEHR